ncbi:diguanylate cyclase [uncultured Williamsia sp.]|uniref:GGDEF domain-containing protein n=1 Tax=uncultured Williamsia sp. TaxID=259311 RepID=UPI002614C3C4|nr:GGDEF domain-containing protein [uncultured Williamsia sp.]
MADNVTHLLRRWWTREFDRGWAVQHMQSSGLLRSQQIVVGIGCLLFGLSAGLSLPAVNPWVYDSVAAYVVLIAIAASSCVLAAIWWTEPWPPLAASAVFIGYADVAVVTVMAMYRTVYWSMPGLMLLTAVSVYTVMHHGARAVMAQTVATLGATVALASWVGIQGGTPVVNIVIRSLTIVPVTVCIPLLLVPLVATLRHDANGSFRDDMTDLHNRRGMQIHAGELIDHGVAFSLLLIDIDRFKDINDEFGHAAGDNALVVVASVMRRIAPSHAVVSRIGGDEFAIVLDGDHPMATRTAEALHHAIAAEGATGSVPRMTVSIGIATVPPDISGDALFVDLDQVLLRADRAMYAAKHDGGARTVQA